MQSIRLLKQVSALLFLITQVSFVFGQETKANEPQEEIVVKTETDEHGNITSYDSSYSYSYTDSVTGSTVVKQFHSFSSSEMPKEGAFQFFYGPNTAKSDSTTITPEQFFEEMRKQQEAMMRQFFGQGQQEQQTQADSINQK
ncbi:hypothetical protein [Sediminitomix flava]|uniref:Uncharacterized protein n=1 Tax=Sediminitomix flava TaxID=379075 RepID=A0A315ZHR1_SEDFL|nr:hypothetical protein [Sediminitomix flava]PWJ44842.1 hypothetical protein BC781_1011221 [Sediminitomix flava]